MLYFVAPNKGIFQTPNGDICPVKTAAGQAATGADRTLIAAVTGKIIIPIWALFQCSTGAANASFNLYSASSAGTALSGQMILIGASPPVPLFADCFGITQTVVSEALIGVSGTNHVNYTIRYIEASA